MKIGEYLMVGKKLIGLCIAALLVSQTAMAYNAGASGRIMNEVSIEPTNSADCIGGPEGSDCVSSDPGYLPYEDTYAKCEIILSKNELAKEAKTQKEIDALYEKINALYEKINEKSAKLPQHLNDTCMEQVNREQLKKSCKLTDADLEEMDRINAEMNALYGKLSGADDTQTWDEINRLGEKLSNMYSNCVYQNVDSWDVPGDDPYAKCEIILSKEEQKKEDKLQKEIDALYEQVNALYEKVNEKSEQLPAHYDQKCIEQVDREMLKERCNLTDDDLAKIDSIQSEINALYENLNGASDESTWKEINRKGEEINEISACVYGPVLYKL
jgi:uncharacterized coiled-coil protein SlyX